MVKLRAPACRIVPSLRRKRRDEAIMGPLLLDTFRHCGYLRIGLSPPRRWPCACDTATGWWKGLTNRPTVPVVSCFETEHTTDSSVRI